MTSTTPSITDLDRTARIITQAQWGVAAVVMTGSAIAGGFAFYDLTHNPWVIISGVITALAVDWALAKWLQLSRILRAVGIRSPWGRALELVTAAMTIYLNLGAAVFPLLEPKTPTALWLLGIAHIFVPVLLILVFRASGEANDLLMGITRAREAEEETTRTARLAADRAAYEAERRHREATAREDRAREDRIRQDGIRAQELATREKELAVTATREAQAHETRQLIGALAGIMTLSVASRPRAVPQASPSRPTRPRPSVPTVSPVPTQSGDMVSRARDWRASRTAKGLPAGRDELRRYLGISERVAKSVIKELNAERPLRAVSGGAR